MTDGIHPSAWRSGAAPPLVRLEAVSKNWGDRVVLDRADLEIHAGTVVGVAGGNGAGKTTLLRIAAGIITPDEGAVLVRGEEDIEQDLRRYQQTVGFLSAGDRGLYARLTVWQNLDFWAGLSRLSARDRRDRIVDVLCELDLDELWQHRVDRLSMGQRQRVRLAMALLHQPRIVVLDEPRTSLDEAGFSLLGAVVGRLVGDGAAVLWASPDPGEALLDESWVLEAGKLRRFQPPTTEAHQPALAEVTAVTAGYRR